MFSCAAVEVGGMSLRKRRRRIRLKSKERKRRKEIGKLL